MNLKGLLLFMIALNIVSAYFMIGCISTSSNINPDGQCSTLTEDNSVIKFFFDYNKETAMNSTQINVSSSMENQLEDSLKEEAGGSSTFADITKFLDGLRMVMGFLTILTPFPIIIFFSSLGIPAYFIFFITIPLLAGWILSIIDIIRGFRS